MFKFFPQAELIIPKEQKNSALNLFNKHHLTFILTKLKPDGSLLVIIRQSSLSSFKGLLSSNNINADITIKKGIFSLFFENKHRVGFLLGMFILIISCVASSKFVWRIEIEGNYKTSDTKILEGLNNVGFSLGSFIPNVDYSDLHNKFLLEVDDISWISINIKGNTANVVVREKLDIIENEKEKYTNIVAKEDGQIKLISVIDGEKQIKIGDIVKKGELLISGVIDSQSQGVRYVNAKGNVLAYVNKDITIKMPVKIDKKAYTGNIIKEKTLTLFKKDIKLYKNNNKTDAMYDIIEKSEYVYLFNKIKLPIQIKTREYYEYNCQSVTYSNQEATELALKQLNEKITQLSDNVELISKDIKTEFKNNTVCIYCSLYCIEDIAKSVKFNVKEK